MPRSSSATIEQYRTVYPILAVRIKLLEQEDSFGEEPADIHAWRETRTMRGTVLYLTIIFLRAVI